MKIIHFSDTHLGFHDLDVLNDKNVNQREADFYHSFTQVIDCILNIKPNFVIHTGDLFHRPHPTNRAITQCLLELKRLTSANIPLIIIAGNHSMPRTSMTSPILDILTSLDNVYPVFSGLYERIEFDNIVFHTLPHNNDEIVALEEIDAIYDNKNTLIDNNKTNILMMHCSVGHKYLMEEYGERVFPKDKDDIFEMMNYVALGHWHGFGKIGKKGNVYYAGSTERTSSSDKRMDKGFVIVDITDNHTNITFETISLRPWQTISIDTSIADSKDKLFIQLEKEIASIQNTSLNILPLVEVTLQKLSTSLSIDISNNEIADYFENALYICVKREFLRKNNDSFQEDVQSISLQEYFLEQLKNDSQSDIEYDRLSAKTNQLFLQYEEKNNDSE